MRPSLCVVAFCLVGSLAGCANQRLAERRQEFADAQRACRISNPPVVGGMVAYATCVNQAGERLDGGGAANALIRATRLSLAEQVDGREISFADAKARFARVVYETSQDLRRNDAANTMATAALLGAMQRPPPQPVYQQQPYVVRMPVQTNCTHMGAMTSCSSQ